MKDDHPAPIASENVRRLSVYACTFATMSDDEFAKACRRTYLEIQKNNKPEALKELNEDAKECVKALRALLGSMQHPSVRGALVALTVEFVEQGMHVDGENASIFGLLMTAGHLVAEQNKLLIH